MAPASSGRCRMGACETTPPATHTGEPATSPNPANPATSRLFLTPNHRPPPASVQLVRPRPRPDGRTGLRALQLDPRTHATARTRQLRGKPAEQAHPARRYQVTGSDQRTVLTNRTPMGAGSRSRLRGSVVLVDHAPKYFAALDRCAGRHDDRFAVVGWPLAAGLVRAVAVVVPGV